MKGRLSVYAYKSTAILPWELRSYSVKERDVSRAIQLEQQNILGFGFVQSPIGFIVTLPHWLFVLVAGLAFAGLRIKRPWRFRLLTLFVATTFFAIVLGMIVKMNR